MANQNKKTYRKFDKNRKSNYKGNRKGKDSGEPRDSEQDVIKVTKDINDISYYVTDPMVLAQATNFSFRDFVGRPIEVGNVQGEVPPLMRVEVTPCIPYTTADHANVDGFNMAMYKIFLEQIKDNKRPVTYGPEDIGMPVLATGSILALAATVERIFGYVSCYNVRNRIWPREVLKSFGVTEDDIEHLADLRVKYNSTVVPMFNKLPMYANFPYFQKCYNMFKNVYTDQDGSSMSQLYYLDVFSVWKYNDIYNEEGAGLDTIPVFEDATESYPQIPMSLTHRIDLMIELTQALMNSTAMLTIQADLMRYAEAHGKSLVSLPPIPDAYALIPVHSPELDYWLDNAFFKPIVPHIFIDDAHTIGNDVVSDSTTHACVYRPTNSFSSDLGDTNVLLNFWHENPSVEERIYATRMATPFTMYEHATGVYRTEDVACCDWTLTRIKFLKGVVTGGWDESPFDVVQWTANRYTIEVNTTLAQVTGWFDLAMKLSQFDHHPRLYIQQRTPEGTELVGIEGDLQYYTSIPFRTLKAIQDVCALGLWRL